METLTKTLEKSIQYEQSKTSLMNLATHKRQDISELIEAIDEKRDALSHMIDSNIYFLDNNEDIEEGLEKKMWESVATYRGKLETLIAWRMILLTAWNSVKR